MLKSHPQRRYRHCPTTTKSFRCRQHNHRGVIHKAVLGKGGKQRAITSKLGGVERATRKNGWGGDIGRKMTLIVTYGGAICQNSVARGATRGVFSRCNLDWEGATTANHDTKRTLHIQVKPPIASCKIAAQPKTRNKWERDLTGQPLAKLQDKTQQKTLKLPKNRPMVPHQYDFSTKFYKQNSLSKKHNRHLLPQTLSAFVKATYKHCTTSAS